MIWLGEFIIRYSSLLHRLTHLHNKYLKKNKAIYEGGVKTVNIIIHKYNAYPSTLAVCQITTGDWNC